MDANAILYADGTDALATTNPYLADTAPKLSAYGLTPSQLAQLVADAESIIHAQSIQKSALTGFLRPTLVLYYEEFLGKKDLGNVLAMLASAYPRKMVESSGLAGTKIVIADQFTDPFGSKPAVSDYKSIGGVFGGGSLISGKTIAMEEAQRRKALDAAYQMEKTFNAPIVAAMAKEERLNAQLDADRAEAKRKILAEEAAAKAEAAEIAQAEAADWEETKTTLMWAGGILGGIILIAVALYFVFKK